MLTLQQLSKQLDIATFDDTSMDDFNLLLNEYQNIYQQQPADYKQASAKRFQELVQAAIKDAKRYSKTGA